MAAIIKAAVRKLNLKCNSCGNAWVIVSIENDKGESMTYEGCATRGCPAQFIKLAVDKE